MIDGCPAHPNLALPGWQVFLPLGQLENSSGWSDRRQYKQRLSLN